MSSERRISRQFTISLPPEMAKRVEGLADREHRTISELFREAFRVYSEKRLRKILSDAQAIAAANAPSIRSEEDVERLVKETRKQMLSERGKTAVQATK
ncbi:MAG: ribbon-helix-helix domain-containing protein [Acidobacteriota bacterium]|nr:ribbon-helix-helix domain-containing protein [Acidobacteriota bacterium]